MLLLFFSVHLTPLIVVCDLLLPVLTAFVKGLLHIKNETDIMQYKGKEHALIFVTN